MDTRVAELIDLDDARAVASTVGAKAARLADARRRGLPVLPGLVIDAAPGRALVASLLASVADSGPHAASLALMEQVPGAVDLSAAVERAALLGPTLVARSTSSVEDDPLWSGAFSSFLEIEPSQLVTAVAGCWASTLSPSVLALCEQTGTDPAEVCPAVLVQPMIEPQASGTATFGPGRGGGTGAEGDPGRGGGTGAGDGVGPGGRSVEIVAVWGSPAPLMAGWSEGWRATVTGQAVRGPAVGEPSARGRVPEQLFPEEWLRDVAALAEAACGGEPASIEWAVVDGRAVLLQARPAVVVGRPGAAGRATEPGPAPGAVQAPGVGEAPGAGEVPGDPDAPALLCSPEWARVARTVMRYGGPLGDRLVLPWLLATNLAEPSPSSQPGGDPGPSSAPGHALDRFDDAVRSAQALSAAATGEPSGQDEEAASRILGRLAAGHLKALASLRPVEVRDAARTLLALAEAGATLVEQGALAHPEQLWSLSPDEVRTLLARPVTGDWHRHRQRTLGWQALVQRVIAGLGRSVPGDGVAPGIAAGAARRLNGLRDLRRVVPGDVVVLRRPSPNLAPALWVASGLVAESGSGAAHLVEVARSLRLPAVVGVGPLEVDDGADLVLVDGDAEQVTVLRGAD